MDADSPRFFQALAEMSLIFCDEVTKERQKLYWEALHARLTIDEWEYACGAAIDRETFHKVPLPAVLMGYIHEYREEQAKRDKIRALDAKFREAEAQRLLDPPMPPGYVTDQVNGLLAQIGEAVTLPGTAPPLKAPSYRTPLQECEYAERKAALLRQVRMVEAEEKEHD